MTEVEASLYASCHAALAWPEEPRMFCTCCRVPWPRRYLSRLALTEWIVVAYCPVCRLHTER